jgi:ABC-2 type transport system ATP-binding protein
VLNGDINEVRSRYKKQIFKVQILNENPDIHPEWGEILSREKGYQCFIFRIRKTANSSNSEFLSALLKNNEIISFEEEIPSMNDIFIQTVTEN